MKFNVIMLYHPDGQHVLMCQRMKTPYKGKYNLLAERWSPVKTLLMPPIVRS